MIPLFGERFQLQQFKPKVYNWHKRYAFTDTGKSFECYPTEDLFVVAVGRPSTVAILDGESGAIKNIQHQQVKIRTHWFRFPWFKSSEEAERLNKIAAKLEGKHFDMFFMDENMSKARPVLLTYEDIPRVAVAEHDPFEGRRSRAMVVSGNSTFNN